MQILQQKRLSYKAASLVFIASFLALRVYTYFVVPHIQAAKHYNTGIAFDFWHAGGIYTLGVAAVVCICWFCAFLIAQKYFLIPISLILAGSLSNIVDRLQGHGVVDSLYVGTWIGNPADIMIAVGIVWVIWGMIRGNASPH